MTQSPILTLRNVIKYLILLELLFFSILPGFSQNFKLFDKDSLMQVLRTANNDKDKELLLLNIGFAHQGNIRNAHEFDSAVYYYTQSFELSQKLKDTVGMLNYIAYYTNALNAKGRFDESLTLNLQAVTLAEKINNPRKLAAAYNNTANSYDHLLDYQNEIKYSLKSLHIIETEGNKYAEALINGNLCELFTTLKEFKKAYECGLKAIKITRAEGLKDNLEYFLYNTGGALNFLHQYDSALLLLKQSLEIAVQTKDTIFQVSTLSVINEVNINTGQYDQILKNAERGLSMAMAVKYQRGIGQSLLSLAQYYFYKKNYPLAEANAKRAVQVSKENGLNDIFLPLYLLLSDIELARGNISAFVLNRNRSDSMQAATLSAEIVKNTQDLEAKYSLTKKQGEIDNLNKEKKINELTIRQRNILNWVLVTTLLILGFIVYLYYRNHQQKNKLLFAEDALQKQRIHELEQEKQLFATQSIVKGQEEERKRLAKDLHDGLGGLLTGVKISLSNMKDNMIMTGDNVLVFERSLDMLDNSINELRRVAHNMMPEALVKFGLSTALRDFCESVNNMKAIIISFQTVGEQRRLDSSQEIVLYRIVQELLNNILKHSGAQRSLVQLVFEPTELAVTVEDNGKGFDKNLLDRSTGSGWPNIRSRVEYLTGSIDVISKPDEGTSVHIRLPV